MEQYKEVSGRLIMVSQLIYKRILNNLLWVVISDGFFRLIIVITSVFIARKLTPDGYGYFSVGQLIGSYGVILIDLWGNTTFAIREISKDKVNADMTIGRILSIRVICSLFVVIAGYVFLIFFNSTSVPTSVVHVSLLFVLAYAFFPDWAFRGLEKNYWLVVGYGVMSFSLLILSIMFVKSPDHVLNALGVWVASYFFGGILLISILKFHSYIRIDKANWFHKRKGDFNSSLKFSLAGIMGITVAQILPYLLLIFSDSTNSGIFAGPLRIVLAICTAGMIIPNAIFPILSSINTQKESFDHLASTFTKFMLVIGVPLAIIGTIWSKEITLIVLGPAYIQSIPVVTIIVWVIPLSYLIYSLEYSLLATGREGRRLIANTVSVLILFALAFPLIKESGAIGAAIVFLTAHFILAVTLIIFNFNSILNGSQIINYLKLVIVFLGMYFVVQLSKYWNVGVWTLLLGILIYPFLLLQLNVFDRGVVKNILRSLYKKPTIQ